MKIKRDPFLKALLAVAPLTGKRTTQPILNCFLLGLNSGHLFVRANDAECDAVEIFDTELSIEKLTAFETCCVSAPRLVALVRGCGEELEINSRDGKVSIGSGSKKALLLTLPAAEFPPPDNGDVKSVGLNAADLARAIRASAWAADQSNPRLEYGMVHVYVKDGKIRADASTGRIVARCQIAAIAAECDFLIPAKFAEMACGALERDGATLCLSEGRMLVQHDSGTFLAPLGNTRALPLDVVLGNLPTKVGKVNVKELSDAVLVAQSLANDPMFARIEVSFGPKVVVRLVKGGSDYETEVFGEGIEKVFWFDSKALVPVLKNLSGVANVTTTPEEPHAIVGFDSGDNYFAAGVLRKE